MKKTFFFLVLFVLVKAAFSQSPGPFFRQFYFNPYLFNPAYVAINDQPELNLVYRKQWLNFKDAPVTSGISLQYPTLGRVALGLNIMSDKQVLMTNNTFMGTFGYVIPISSNETLRFGLSAGVGTNKLDLTADELNLNDPAIINAANNNVYVDGNFGVVYTNKGLRVGFALTEIFKSNPFSEESFNKFSLSNLRNRLYSASYRFNVGIMENFSLEPYVLYRQSEDGLQDAWEAATIVYYKDLLWAGTSYNKNNGLGLFVGMNVINKFRFSYSYELPPFNSDITSTSSHELHLGFRFGSKKSRALVKQPVAQPIQVATVKQDSTYQEAIATPVEERVEIEEKAAIAQTAPESEVKQSDEPNRTEIKSQPIVETQTVANPPAKIIEEDTQVAKEIIPEKKTGTPPRSFTLASGHYVVAGAFSILNYATRYSRQLEGRGYEANVALNPRNNLYYVYIFSSYDIDEAKKVRNQYRLKNLFREAWLYTME